MEQRNNDDKQCKERDEIANNLQNLTVEDRQVEAVETTDLETVSSESDVDSSEEESEEPQSTDQPRCRPIQIWRQWVDPHGGGYSMNAADMNHPLGPPSIPRITRPTPPGSYPDLRFYDFPNGNEGIEGVDPRLLTPTWHAWAGWLGPKASFRVRWGSPYPIRKYSANEAPAPRRTLPTVRAPKRSFRVDFITPIPYGTDIVFSRVCRIFVQPYFGDRSDIESLFGEVGRSSVLPRINVPSGESFNMFPDPVPLGLLPDCPYGGTLRGFTRDQVKLAAMIRCIQLYLMPTRTVSMSDPIGLFLLFGADGVNHTEDSETVETEEELD